MMNLAVQKLKATHQHLSCLVMHVRCVMIVNDSVGTDQEEVECHLQSEINSELVSVYEEIKPRNPSNENSNSRAATVHT